MQQTRLIPLASFLGADLIVVGLGAVLLLRPDWLSYQAELAGREWSELEPAIQQLWLGQQKMLGSALLAVGALIAVVLYYPFRRGEYWSRWALLLAGSWQAAGALGVLYHQGIWSPATFPAALVWAELALFLLGFVLTGGERSGKETH